MKRVILFIFLVLFSVFSFSQEIRTLFSGDSSEKITFGGYGAPLIRTSQINNNWGLMIGGKGGVIINRSLVFGGIGMGLVGGLNFSGDNFKGNKKAALKLGYGVGGIFFEYLFNLESPIHISIPLNFMAGRVSVGEDTSSTSSSIKSSLRQIESSAIFVIEPGINVEFNVFKYLIAGVNVSYRQALGISLKNLNNQDISGLNIGLIFKFGYF